MAGIRRRLRPYTLFISLVCVVLLLLEWLVRASIVPSFILPAPSQVFMMIVQNWQVLVLKHLRVTMLEFLIGFIISIAGGVGLAVSMFMSKTIEKALYPGVLTSQTIPIIVLSPVFVLWFGYTIWSKVAVTVLLSFFPIVVGTYDGLRSGDKAYIELLRTMGATRWHTFMKLNVPMALPSFFSGLKVAIVNALVGATIGEWFGANEGLGYFSRRMSGNLNAEGVFAAVVLLAVMGMLLFSCVSLIEKRILRWKNN